MPGGRLPIPARAIRCRGRKWFPGSTLRIHRNWPSASASSQSTAGGRCAGPPATRRRVPSSASCRPLRECGRRPHQAAPVQRVPARWRIRSRGAGMLHLVRTRRFRGWWPLRSAPVWWKQCDRADDGAAPLCRQAEAGGVDRLPRLTIPTDCRPASASGLDESSQASSAAGAARPSS